MEAKLIKTRNLYLGISLFIALFGFIYELFSHRVYSGYMIFAFLFPLLGGFLPYLFFAIDGRNASPRTLSACFYNAGIAALTAGSLFRGVLVIYGTTSHLEKWYWITGVLLVALGFGFYLAERFWASATGACRRADKTTPTR